MKAGDSHVLGARDKVKSLNVRDFTQYESIPHYLFSIICERVFALEVWHSKCPSIGT